MRLTSTRTFRNNSINFVDFSFLRVWSRHKVGALLEILKHFFLLLQVQVNEATLCVNES